MTHKKEQNKQTQKIAQTISTVLIINRDKKQPGQTGKAEKLISQEEGHIIINTKIRN